MGQRASHDWRKHLKHCSREVQDGEVGGFGKVWMEHELQPLRAQNNHDFDSAEDVFYYVFIEHYVYMMLFFSSCNSAHLVPFFSTLRVNNQLNHSERSLVQSAIGTVCSTSHSSESLRITEFDILIMLHGFSFKPAHSSSQHLYVVCTRKVYWILLKWFIEWKTQDKNILIWDGNMCLFGNYPKGQMVFMSCTHLYFIINRIVMSWGLHALKTEEYKHDHR